MKSTQTAALSIVLLVSGCGDDSGTGGNNQNVSSIVCGNGLIESGELCDDGELNSDNQPDACRTDCRLAYCGDRVVDTNETCDDGQSNSDFLAGACRSDCHPFRCGDGVVDPGEECDDANAMDGDGCSGQCVVDDYWQCTGAPSQCACQDFRLGDHCEQCRLFVHQDTAGAEQDGVTWETAFPTVQQGIDAAYDAGPGCEVWVAAGTYRVMQSSIFNTVELRSGVGVYGGFAGTETERSERDWQVNETILDGEHVTEDKAVMHVVTAEDTLDATLDGFVIRLGFAQGPRAEDNLGAGMLALGAVMTIENCRFTENYAVVDGGGLYAYGSDLRIRSSSFVNNAALRDGAGLLVGLTYLELDRCEIRGDPFMLSSGGAGGGLNSQASEVSAVNSLFVQNHAQGDGGGIYSIYSSISLLHCTVAANTTTLGDGDSFYNGAVSQMDITSSLIVGDFYRYGTTDVTASYCVLPDADLISAGTDNLYQIPSFAGVGDFHLTLTSPSYGIDHADGLAAPATDLEGNPRYNEPSHIDSYDCGGQPDCVSYADCGAYEYH